MSTTPARRSLTPEELSRVSWHISSRSPSGGGNCVEAGPVRDGSGRVAIRHSHHPSGELLVATRADWAAFLTTLHPTTDSPDD